LKRRNQFNPAIESRNHQWKATGHLITSSRNFSHAALTKERAGMVTTALNIRTGARQKKRLVMKKYLAEKKSKGMTA
jgi:hypothetical protein